MQQLSEAWLMAHEANIFLLNAIEDKYLGDRYTSRSRPVAAQFAHMHNFRMRWLTHAAPEFAAQVAQFPHGADLDKEDLIDALQLSAGVIAKYLDQCEAEGKVANWSGQPASLLAYLVAHDAHHRGQVMAALNGAGHKRSDEVIAGLWEWQ